MEKTFTFNGSFRKDTFGNVVVDTCKSDDEHLVNAATDPRTGKPSCRKLVNAFDDLAGLSGHLVVYVQFEECSDCDGEF